MSIFNSIANFFAPKDENVRVRDVVRELPGAALDVAKSVARGGAEFAVSAGEAPARLTSKKASTAILPPKEIPGLEFLGPIQSIQSKALQKQQEGKSAASAIGGATFETLLNEPVGVAFKPLAIGGTLIAKQLKEPIEKFVGTIAKSKSVEEITGVLKQMFKGGDAEIQSVASTLTKVDKPEDVKAIIDPFIEQTRQSKFAESVKESANVAPEVKAALEAKDTTYQVLPNKQIKDEAKKLVAEDENAAMTQIFAKPTPDAQDVATSIELLSKLQKEGRADEAATLVDFMSQKLTKAGQTVQAARLLQQMTPETVIYKATKKIQETNAGGTILRGKKELDKDIVDQLGKLAEDMNKTTDPVLKREFSDNINSIINSLGEVTLGKKISTFQTIAQLLNPKTLLVRNPLGNELFYRMEQLQRIAATPIDWGLSKLAGKERKVTFRNMNQGGYWDGFMTGLRSGWKGISAYGIEGQFDAYTPAFKAKWNPLTYLEKTLRATLQGFDVAAFNRAKNSVIGEQAYLKALNEGYRGKELVEKAKEYFGKVDTNVLQLAEDYGKYVTFQDENALARAFSTIKKGLNVGKDFGFGDLIVKYPKTPASIITRALEYSPAGFLRSAYLLSQPFFKKELNNRDVAMATSRAIIGSLGLSGMGYFLADRGIITGKSDKDFDVTNLNRQTGKTQYQINISALKRFVLSGFDEKEATIRKGDTLYSYDWAQPLAIALSLGANASQQQEESAQMAEKKGPFAGVVSGLPSAAEGAFNTITEQPLIAGIKSFFGQQGGITEGIANSLESAAAGFVPTLSNQLRQVESNIARETYDPNIFKRAVNRVMNRLPIINKELPIKYNTMGKAQNVYQQDSLFNIFLNPGFVTKFRPSPAAQIVLDVYNESGEGKVFPRQVPNNISLYNKKFELTGKQKSDLQKGIGQKTDAIFTIFAQNEQFRNAPVDTQVKLLSDTLSNIWASERLKVLTPEQRKYLIEGLTPKQQKDLASDIAKMSL